MAEDLSPNPPEQVPETGQSRDDSLQGAEEGARLRSLFLDLDIGVPDGDESEGPRLKDLNALEKEMEEEEDEPLDELASGIEAGGDPVRVSLEEGHALSTEKSVDVLAVEEALLELESCDPRAAKVVEMKFYGGMTEVEIAERLGLSRRTVQNEWRMAKAWLRNYIVGSDPD